MKKYIQVVIFCLISQLVFAQTSGLQIPFSESFNYQSSNDFYKNWDSSGVEIVKLTDAPAGYGIRFNGVMFNKAKYSDSAKVDSAVRIKTDTVVSKTINSTTLNSKKAVTVEFVWQGGGFGTSTQPISQNGDRLILYVKNNNNSKWDTLWRSPDSDKFDKLKFYKISLPLSAYITFPTDSLKFKFERIGPSTTNTSLWFVTNFEIGYTNGLPLWEDFSNADSYRKHFKPNTGVYINNHLPINPPSINVASFDGVDDIGNPYYDISETEMGMADSLVSWPIDIDINTSGISPRDSLRFAFYYQKQGNGEEADVSEGDSLVLLFYNKYNQWKSVWHSSFTEATDPAKFYQVLLTVKDSSYFHKDFKFKFFNYCRLSGAFDLWHIDYLTIDTISTNSSSSTRQIENGKMAYSDISVSGSPSSIIGPYKSIPAKHVSSANFNITSGSNYYVGNLAIGDNRITPTIKIYKQGQAGNTFENTNPITIPPGVSKITQNYTSLEVKNSLPATPDTSTKPFKVINKIDVGSPTINFGDYLFTNNDVDSTVFTFDDYYAYDDGTYEIGEMLKQTNAKQALGFDFYGNGEDVLTDIDICLPHVGYNIDKKLFLLKVWDDLNGKPGRELYSRGELIAHATGRNPFTRYRLTKRVPIKGRFYIGYQQFDGAKASIKIGYDLSNDNKGQLWYDNNQGHGWSQSRSVEGTLMIRAVFGKAIIKSSTAAAKLETKFDMVPYPNPSNSEINIKDKSTESDVVMDWIEIIDHTSRRRVYENNTSKVDVSFLTPGHYFIKGMKDGNIYRDKIVIEAK